FRCLTCSGEHGWCHTCVLKAHQSLPFHKLQLWNGTCFQDTSLSELGYIWHMGHGDHPCPFSQDVTQEWEDVNENIDESEKYAGVETVVGPALRTTALTIVHSTGVFIHNVQWCHCPESSVHQQHLHLLKAQLFPASTTRPQTAFTFEVLDHFLIDALECKTSAMSFFQKLCQ
ncbi:hypothetical protein DFJ58DRAFT_668290, partial [Suillus subalutaceus]|uniref:uncharacterized protein n=1 Tax=Suillus subalutaceus TaxID=48586 RepID=UPI001B85DD15